MGLFSKSEPKYCGVCGKKGFVIKNKCLDGEMNLCIDCSAKIPKEMTADGILMWTVQETLDFFKYLEGQAALLELLPESKKLYRYGNVIAGDLLVDYEHELLYVDHGGGYNDKTGGGIVFEFSNIESIDFEFMPAVFKEKMFGDVVEGPLFLNMRISEPKVDFRLLLEKKMRSSAYASGFFTRNVAVARIEELELKKVSLRRKIELARQRKRNEAKAAMPEKVNISDIQKALNLFMFNDVEKIELRELDNQRERLIKVFCAEGMPDSKNAMERINGAYELIRNL